jgi:hypothetical protein
VYMCEIELSDPHNSVTVISHKRFLALTIPAAFLIMLIVSQIKIDSLLRACQPETKRYRRNSSLVLFDSVKTALKDFID